MTVTKAVEESRVALREALLSLEDELRKTGSWSAVEKPFDRVRLLATELIERSAE